jgi:mannose-6-phosphate isomerase-like protein (cupin superfamily)
MKLNPSDRTPVTGPDGHSVREVVGLNTMNLAKYSVAHVVVPAGSQGETRVNQFDEVMIVIKGRGTARRDHARDELGPEDVLLLPNGTRYAIDAAPDSDLELWAICVPAFRPEWTNVGTRKMDWRDYQTPRGSDRLREIQERNENK